MFGSNVWGALIGRACRTPVVIAHQHGWSFEQRWRRFVDGRLIGRLVSAFVAGTSADAERMKREERVPAHKVVIIPGAYVPRPSGQNEDLRAELRIPADGRVVGTIGVLRPEKGYDVLLHAFSRLNSKLPQTHLVLAGDGSCRAALESLAVRLDIAAKVHFLGARDDLDTLFAAMDVASISSHRESTSLFALECIAHDLPLVSTRVGGPAEFLEDGISALLVPPGDADALATALERVLRLPDAGRALAQAARRGLAPFEIERVAGQHAALYERLLAPLDARARSEPAAQPTPDPPPDGAKLPRRELPDQQQDEDVGERAAGCSHEPVENG